MRTNDCPNCNARNSLQSTVCHNCGKSITYGGKLKILLGQLIIGAILVGIFVLISKS